MDGRTNKESKITMSEFNNRIETQRRTLRLVNSTTQSNEPLLSLAEKAISRWIIVNGINPNNKMVNIIREISAKLFFLANKSQEQITDDYAEISKTVETLIDQLRMEALEKSDSLIRID